MVVGLGTGIDTLPAATIMVMLEGMVSGSMDPAQHEQP